MSLDISFLHTKQLVYSSPLPIPFCIYNGMGEHVYMLGNVAAFSTLYSPGVYRVLHAIISYISTKPVIIDDIFGMLAEVKDAEHYVWTRAFISKLTSLNRITWECPHRDMPPVISDADMLAFVSPAAYLHANRLEIASAESIDNKRRKWFIVPAGDVSRYRQVTQYYADALKRDVYQVYIPTTAIDSCWCLIAPEGVKLEKVPFSMYVKKVERRKSRRPDHAVEKMMYEGTIG